jgi:hypothetical protein
MVHLYHTRDKKFIVYIYSGILNKADSEFIKSSFLDYFLETYNITIINFSLTDTKIPDLDFTKDASNFSNMYIKHVNNVYFYGYKGVQLFFIKFFMTRLNFSNKFHLINNLPEIEKQYSLNLNLPNDQFIEIEYYSE